jgi:hypothetical protein
MLMTRFIICELRPRKRSKSVRFVTGTSELREILLDLWKAQGSPLGGYILAGRKGQPIILDNVSKRNIRPTLKEAGVAWHGFYSIRPFHATQVRMESKSSETAGRRPWATQRTFATSITSSRKQFCPMCEKQ